jgi:hypothetical protein
MKIRLQNTDPSLVQGLAADLEGLFADQGLAGSFESSMTGSAKPFAESMP